MTEKSNVPRAEGMIEVAYFLAKYGTLGGPGIRSRPPRELGDVNWNKAYDSFYIQLGDGRRKVRD